MGSQSFDMIWFGKIIILTLALVSNVDGRHMYSEPMAYTTHFGKMPKLDYLQEEKDQKDLLAQKDDGLRIDLGNLNFVLDFKEMRQLQLHETLDGHARRLRPGYSSTIW